MVVIRETKKFLARVGRPVEGELVSTGQLGDWYAGAWFWRPQVALFVNEVTLVPILLPLAPASTVLARLPAGFRLLAARLGVAQPDIDAEVSAMSDVVLAKTASRSVVGIMNEFLHLAENYRETSEEVDLVDLAFWLADVPCSPLYARGVTPGDELKQRLA